MIQGLKAWGPAATWAAVLFLLSELPGSTVGGGIEINDKVVHLGLYAVLGAALAWAGWRWWGAFRLPLILLGMGYGALDEWHQAFVPGRDPSLGDFLADCAGVLLGFLFLRSYLRARAARVQDETNQNRREEHGFPV